MLGNFRFYVPNLLSKICIVFIFTEVLSSTTHPFRYSFPSWSELII